MIKKSIRDAAKLSRFIDDAQLRKSSKRRSTSKAYVTEPRPQHRFRPQSKLSIEQLSSFDEREKSINLQLISPSFQPEQRVAQTIKHAMPGRTGELKILKKFEADKEQSQHGTSEMQLTQDDSDSGTKSACLPLRADNLED